ncbi:unnamed protein product [Urochloa humidicola]
MLTTTPSAPEPGTAASSQQQALPPPARPPPGRAPLASDVMPPPVGPGDAAGSISASSAASKRRLDLELPPPAAPAVNVNSSTLAPFPAPGKQIGSIVGDLEVIDALVSKLKLEDDDVADSDGEEDGLHANDLNYNFDM